MKPVQDKSKGLFFSNNPSPSVVGLFGNFRKIEREMLNLFARKDYETVKSILKNTPEEVKESFFASHGYSILHYAVTSLGDTDSLRIITENVSLNTLQNLLYKNDFEILKDLVRMQHSIENYKISGQTEEEEAQEAMLVQQKLVFLSEIDDELLSDFLEENGQEEYMSESVKKMIRAAIPAETQRHSPSLSPEGAF